MVPRVWNVPLADTSVGVSVKTWFTVTGPIGVAHAPPFDAWFGTPLPAMVREVAEHVTDDVLWRLILGLALNAFQVKLHATPAVEFVPGGVEAGVTLVAVDALLEPIAFRATTAQLYVVPFVSPLTVIGLAVPVAVTVAPLAVQLTV